MNSLERKGLSHFVNKPFNKSVGTLPPKITDLKIWVDINTFKDNYSLTDSPIRLRFVYNKTNYLNRTPPFKFFIEIQNIDTGETKNYIQLESDKPYKLWEKYQESGDYKPIDSIDNSIVNAKLIITPINEHGVGPNSIFILPVKEIKIIDLLMTNDYPLNILFENNLHYVFPVDQPKIKPRVMYIYFGNSKKSIEQDHKMSYDDKWFITTPFDNWIDIQKNTNRWLIDEDNSYLKYNENGWKYIDENEISFINNIISTVRPLYQEDLTERGLDFADNHIFKIMFPHPKDKWDNMYIYFIRGSRWQI